jgi:hypothetical protein
MSDETNNLAVKIARLLQTETQNADFSALRASVEKIGERLENIERKLETQNSNTFPASGLRLPAFKHPSQEKFDVSEIISDEAIENSEEKPCPYEPTGKPCDHCSMCNSRGF